MNLLEREIVEPLRGLMGAELERVIYHPLKGECTAEDLKKSNYIGGGISFCFSGVGPRYISWAENAGWRSHFSIKVSLESDLVSGAFETFDASNTKLWREIIGRKLTRIECLGWDQSPHVLKLTFEDFTRFVGSSYKERFGDGDDIYFCDASDMPDLSEASVIWQKR